MKYERRYIQFNDLVLDGFDMISDYDSNISFKGSSTDISYGHGRYRPFKANYLFIDEQQVSMTITLKMLKLPCEYRPFYDRFAIEELTKPGKLWAIKNGELLWANAAVESISENYSHRDDMLVYDVNFVIPGGVWNKADKQKTFIVPWDICLFMECKDYKTLDPCEELNKSTGDCCLDCINSKVGVIPERNDCYCCCADEIKCEMALCYHMDKLDSFYSCDTRYQVVYDCKKAADFTKEKFLGQKICTQDCDDSVIAGRFYSETEIPTEDVTIIIDGKMNSPWVTINGNTNVIQGEYEGSLIIKPNGDVYHRSPDGCCDTLLDPSVWVIPNQNEHRYGWTVYPGSNSIIVNLNNCCEGRDCVYIQHQAITM